LVDPERKSVYILGSMAARKMILGSF